MSRVRPEPEKRPRFGAAHVLLLAASAAGLCPTFAAYAQERPALRGAVTEEEINDYLLRKTPRGVDRNATAQANDQARTEPLPDYVPITPGALPDEVNVPPENGSLFADPADATGAENPFEDAPVPVPRQTSTARARAEGRPQTAAERLAAEDAATEDAAEGTVRVDTVDSDDDNTIDDGAERVEAIDGLDKLPDDQPFAAPGLRVGTFIVKPTLEQGVTATSNADFSSTGSDAVLSETTLRLNAVSDWSSHSATIDAYGNYRKSLSGDEVEDAEGGLDADLELELGKDYRARATFGYLMRPETAASPVVIVGAASQPLRQAIDGSLGLEKDVGKARLRVTGSAGRDLFGDAELESGGTLSQTERNSTLYLVTLRAGYEISPAVTPFVETEIGRRIYELELDSAGYARSSDRLGARAGVALDLAEKLSGEFSAGWIREGFDDDRLTSISGLAANANLTWSPERGTTVNLFGSTSVEGTTTAGESGSIFYSGRLAVDREIRANLTGNATVGVGWRDYAGSNDYDLILDAEAGLTYWLSRYAGLTGRARHETVKSNRPDRDAETNSVFLGLKLQR